jgi:ankyrin repeat protein
MTETMVAIKAICTPNEALDAFLMMCENIPPSTEGQDAFFKKVKLNKSQRESFSESISYLTDISLTEGMLDLSLLAGGGYKEISFVKFMAKIGASYAYVTIDWGGGEDHRRYGTVDGKKVKPWEFMKAVRERSPELSMVLAVELGESELVKELLAKGISPSLIVAGESLLQTACKGERFTSATPEIIRILIAAGADANFTSDISPLSALLLCIKPFNDFNGFARREDILKELILSGANPNTSDPDGDSALMKSVNGGLTTETELLLKHGAEVNANNNAGQNALFFLHGFRKKKARTQIAALLVAAGIDVHHKDNEGNTALVTAYFFHDVQSLFLEMGLRYEDLNIDYPDDVNQAFDQVIYYNQIEKAKELLNADSDASHTPEERIQSQEAIKNAVAYGRVEILILMKAAGWRLELENGTSLSALAAQEGRLNVLKHLQTEGLSLKEGDNNESALTSLAVDAGADDIIHYLLGIGCVNAVSLSTLNRAIDRCEPASVRALAELAPNNWPDAESFYSAISLNSTEMIQLLLDVGGTLPDDALYKAVFSRVRARENGNLHLIRYLFEQGAKLDGTCDRNGETPLIDAIQWYSKDTMDFLIAKGCDIHLADKQGRNPISHAVGKRNTYAVDALLAAGANIYAKDNRGYSTLSYLKEDNQFGIREKILAYSKINMEKA